MRTLHSESFSLGIGPSASHLCLRSLGASMRQLDSEIERSPGKMTLVFRVCHLSSAVASLLESTLDVAGAGFRRGFLPLSRLCVLQGHDLRLMVRSQLTSVGCLPCLRHSRYVIGSS